MALKNVTTPARELEFRSWNSLGPSENIAGTSENLSFIEAKLVVVENHDIWIKIDPEKPPSSTHGK